MRLKQTQSIDKNGSIYGWARFCRMHFSIAICGFSVALNILPSQAQAESKSAESKPVESKGASRSEDELLHILDSETEDGLFQERQELTISLRKLLGTTTAEQNIFLSFIDQNQFEKALFQWWSAFQGSDFQKTASGQALYAYLLFKNHLEVNGLQSLMSITEPKKIHSDLVKLWRLLVPAGHAAWDHVRVPDWTNEWTSVFDVATEVQVSTRQVHDLSQTQQLFELMRKTQLGTRERSWIEWQMALGLALNQDIAKAAKILAHLMKSDSAQVISSDLQNITAARLLYQRGLLGPAITYYSRVPKKSEYWFTAQEESAWAYIRKGEPQNALAVTQTLMEPNFAPQVGPEAVFLRSLAYLKVCDYQGVVKIINEFRRRFRDRSRDMIQLRETGQSLAVNKLLSALSQGRVSLLSLGEEAGKIPRYSSRDEVLFDLVQTQSALEKEVNLAGVLYAHSLAGASDRIGFQGRIEELKKNAEQMLQVAKSATSSRIKNLATEEVVEIQTILQKMHIVEAEVIQQIDRAEGVIRANHRVPSSQIKISTQLGTTGSQDRDALKFPFDGETWFDEFANYKVDIKKGCQVSKGDSH